jgi:hypothetical protein
MLYTIDSPIAPRAIMLPVVIPVTMAWRSAVSGGTVYLVLHVTSY